ncbi:hypothetical protein [Haloactinomyces albus]|uniref:DNA-binding beta-propeller fold protein YncE n=1 Tax=Haloactinomyces albus TaxID=1352928 RepID=A0AAE4CMR9_9ACTN|nr:hypothetical protein [Haloactinomyces albus]MDR7299893.1 hypothetical protein [Haloactinomyces albus]
MHPVRLRWRTRRVLAVAVVAVFGLAGCSAAGTPARPGNPVAVLRIEVPVHEPMWSHTEQVLLALAEHSPRIAKIDPSARLGTPSTARTTLSRPLRDVGENIVTSPTGDDVVYVPQPNLDRIAVVGLEGLRRVEVVQAGPSPSFLAIDVGSHVLLALSEDGSTVTKVDMQGSTALPADDVRAGPQAELDGAKRGRRIEYHVAGPDGIAHYKGVPTSVHKKSEIPISAEKTAGDLVKASRVYVAVTGTDRLLAVQTTPTGEGMEVVAQARLGEPVRHLGVDETRIYAATEHELVVFETNSFEGYAHHRFPLVETIDFRAALQNRALENAPLSGLAVGSDRVYLTLQGHPHVVSVAKPNL